MGGSVNSILFGRQPNFEPQELSNDQILYAVRNGYSENAKPSGGGLFGTIRRMSGGGQGLRDAYHEELVNQLRNGTFEDGYGVYQEVLNQPGRQVLMKNYTPPKQPAVDQQTQEEQQ